MSVTMLSYLFIFKGFNGFEAYYATGIMVLLFSIFYSYMSWKNLSKENSRMLRFWFKLRVLHLYAFATSFLLISLCLLGMAFYLGLLYINNTTIPMLSIPFFTIISAWPFYMFRKNLQETRKQIYGSRPDKRKDLLSWSWFLFLCSILSLILFVAYIVKHYYDVPNALFLCITFSAGILFAVVGEALRQHE
jgi:hypothetical protein